MYVYILYEYVCVHISVCIYVCFWGFPGGALFLLLALCWGIIPTFLLVFGEWYVVLWTEHRKAAFKANCPTGCTISLALVYILFNKALFVTNCKLS